MDIKIKDLWDNNIWHLERLWTPLSKEIVSLISSKHPQLCPDITDTFVWSEPVSGRYTARSGYRWLNDHEASNISMPWSWIWKLAAPENIRCTGHEETIFHCLRDCISAKEVWGRLGLDLEDAFYANVPLSLWIRKGVAAHDSLFLATVWILWKHRNMATFDNKLVPV
ncbi:ribonuclease H [Sesbania bispinosa]|nr:ribonuclease H [Sesbania bispinosa]